MTKLTSLNARVAFLGLGNMGLPMAKNLAARCALPPRVFDLDGRQVRALSEVASVTRTATPAEAAEGCDVAILMLPNGKIVHDVLTQGKVLQEMSPGGLVIDMSSSAPATYDDLLTTAKSRDIALVDAPVSGGVPRAKTGELTIMAGGSDNDFLRAEPILRTMGTSIFHTGPLGAGQAVKALNNLLSAGTMALTVETLLLGRAFGLDPHILNQVLNVSTGRNNSTDKKVEQHILSGKYSSGFALGLLNKDVQTAVSMLPSAQKLAPFSTRIAKDIDDACTALGGQSDHTELAKYAEKRAGVDLQKKS